MLEEGDYENTLVKWWESWRFPAPVRDSLPLDGLGGIMVSKDGVDICAGFYYLTNSKTAWCEYIISNFEVKDKSLRDEAIVLLINTISIMLKDAGFKYIYTSLKNTSLIERYKMCGYLEGSNECTEMIKIL